MWWDLKISLTTVSHMASCNLGNLFLEVWKLAEMYHFAIYKISDLVSVNFTKSNFIDKSDGFRNLQQLR